MNSKELAAYLEKHFDKFVKVTSDYTDGINKLDEARKEYKNSFLEQCKKLVVIIWPVLIIISVLVLHFLNIPIQISFGKFQVSSCYASAPNSVDKAFESKKHE